MISKETLGHRVRGIRQGLRMTLKDVENKSGLSATHISEIERGMTSPTVGALIRIAGALQKDPGFFIEPREMDEVCVISDGDRPAGLLVQGVSVEGGRCEPLTRGILGGRISVHEISLDPGGSASVDWLHLGDDVCFYCVEGEAEVLVGSQRLEMLAGDSVHGGLTDASCRARGGEMGCRLLLIVDLRENPHPLAGT